MTRTSAVGLGVSRDKNRRGKQYRCRLFHHRGLLDLGRFETEDEAKMAYDQAVRALKLEKSLNYPATSSKYFSPDVARKVQAFMAKNIMEPSNSSSSTPGGDDQHTDMHESPTTSGNSTASGGLSGCGHVGQGQHHHHLHAYADADYMYMQHPDHEYMQHHADMNAMDQAAVEALAAAAAATGGMPDYQHMEVMPDMMQLGGQHMGGGAYCDGATDMLLPPHQQQQQGYAACPWEEAALQMHGGPPAPTSYEAAQQQGMMAGCCDMNQQLGCAGVQYKEEAAAMHDFEQQQHADMCLQQQQEYAQVQPDQQQQLPAQQQQQGKATDDVRVMLALLAEILAEDEIHGPADLLDECPAEVSHALLQDQQEQPEDTFLQIHQHEQQEQDAFLPPHQDEQHQHQGYPMQTHQEQPQEYGGNGYLGAPACAYLQAGPQGSPSTPVLQDSSSDTLGYHAAASLECQQQPQPQQQLDCHVQQAQPQQWVPAANTTGGRIVHEPQQAHAQLPCLVSYGEVVLFVDVTTRLMLQLYTKLTANSVQHAGLTAIQWMADVRMNLGLPGPSTPGNSPSLSAAGGAQGAGGLPAAVHAAVLHTCSSLVSVSAGSGPDMAMALSGGGDSFSSCFLVTTLEQVLKALMSLRSMCSVCCPTDTLCSSVVSTMQGQLQAQSNTHEGQAVVALLGWLLGYV